MEYFDVYGLSRGLECSLIYGRLGIVSVFHACARGAAFSGIGNVFSGGRAMEISTAFLAERFAARVARRTFVVFFVVIIKRKGVFGKGSFEVKRVRKLVNW